MSYDLYRGYSLSDYQIRTLDILTLTEKLLLQFGYSKLTMDDIANATNLGKGTIYLHWKSKEELFYALLSKVTSEIVYEILETIKIDKDAVILDNLLVKLYSVCCERKILVALFTKNSRLLGKLVTKNLSTKSLNIKTESLRKSIEMYRLNKMMRVEEPIDIQLHAINLLMTGIFNYNSYLNQPLSMDNHIMLIKTISKNTLLPNEPCVVNDEIYHYIYGEFERLLEFYKNQTLYSTIK